jgi:hypothetical protein
MLLIGSGLMSFMRIQPSRMDFAICAQNSVADLPCGQRCVTTFVRVKKRTLPSPYWLMSPKAESFQPPWL